MMTKTGLALGLGVFDGMHLGHQALAANCTYLLTFSPHPDKILNKDSELRRLSTPDELKHWMPNVKVMKFTPAVAAWSPTEFLDNVLETYQPTTLVVGYDFRFGVGGEGNVNSLRAWAADKSIEVIEVPPVEMNGVAVKSQRIREAILDGSFLQAVQLMGHPYLMIGTVEHGDGRGRQLGYPTANLSVPSDKLIPASGVYCGTAILGRKKWAAMIYVGKRPTVSDGEVQVEVHLLDYHGAEIYGDRIKVLFETRLRGDIKFASVAELIQQIRRDVASAQRLSSTQ